MGERREAETKSATRRLVGVAGAWRPLRRSTSKGEAREATDYSARGSLTHGLCWFVSMMQIFNSAIPTRAVFSSKKILCEKKIHRHIKLAIHVWSTKCR
jgi:hypothetical protein